jgi:hypothetical protein
VHRDLSPVDCADRPLRPRMGAGYVYKGIAFTLIDFVFLTPIKLSMLSFYLALMD